MEPKRFCGYCDSKSKDGVPCAVEEFYPKKGFCSYPTIEGVPVQIDCLNIHVGEKIIFREDRSGLVEVIWQEKLKKEGHSQLNLKRFISWART